MRDSADSGPSDALVRPDANPRPTHANPCPGYSALAGRNVAGDAPSAGGSRGVAEVENAQAVQSRVSPDPHRLSKITDVAGRDTLLEYNGFGGRLSRVTDMAGRVHTYEYYDASAPELLRGNLKSITDGVVTNRDGTTTALTTTFGYDAANQLEWVRTPNGHTSLIRYEVHESWEPETAGTNGANGWEPGSASTVSVRRSLEAHHDGSGQPAGAASLELDLHQADATVPGVAFKSYAPALTLGAVPEELVLWAYKADASSSPVYAKVVVEHNNGETTEKEVLLEDQKWTPIRMPNTQVDPAWYVTKISVLVYPKTGHYNGQVYLDQVFAKGVAQALTDARPARNELVRFDYDWPARTTRVTRPDTAGDPSTVQFRHDPSGQVRQVYDPENVKVTEASYDEFLRVSKVLLPGEQSGTNYTYRTDASGQPTNWADTASNELGETGRQGVDDSTGDPLYAVDPLNTYRNSANSASTTYDAGVLNRDADGDVTSVETKTYAKGADLENPTTRSGGTLKRRTEYEYGPGGLVKKMVPPKCVAAADRTTCQTEYFYEAVNGLPANTGYMTRIIAPAGSGEASRRETVITPGRDGRPLSVRQPKGNKAVYTYDEAGRLTQVAYLKPDGTTDHTVRYTLDSNGNMTRMEDETGVTVWTYDENNQVTEESRTQPAGGTTTKTARYAYYDNGLLRTITTFEGKTVSFGYNKRFLLTSQTDPNDVARAKNTVEYIYDSRHRRVAVTFGGDVSREVSYDKAGRVSEIRLVDGVASTSPTTWQRCTYSYGIDAAGAEDATYSGGFVSSVFESTAGDTRTTSYGYDWAGRLASARSVRGDGSVE